MRRVRTTTLVRAPAEVVFDLVRDARGQTAGIRPDRVRLVAPGRIDGLLDAGDVVCARLDYRGLRCGLDAGVVTLDRPARFVLEQVRGPWRLWRNERRLVGTGAGTLMIDTIEWAAAPGLAGRLAGAALPRHGLLGFLARRNAQLRAVAERTTAERTAQGTRVVVGVALLAGGRVLAAQRARPAELAGRWEFPGGKVEQGEDEPAALVRECREELGVTVELHGRLGGDLLLGGGRVLRVWTGRVIDGEPVAREHAALRWLGADQVDDVDWLPADRALTDLLRNRLR